jgi:lipoate-protein ligase A
MTDRPWRLVVTEPLDGPTNMAIDEALWRSRLAGDGPPTLRFFAWAPPAVSLGYGQRLDRGVNVDACRALGVGLVRRPTGGSAIYHDGPERELTYSVVAAVDDFAGAVGVLQSYDWISRGLVAGLRRLGVAAEMVPVMPSGSEPPAFCFARTGTYEIEVGGRKLVGSAQRRRIGGFLQHGSVMLGVDAARVRLIFPGGDPLAGMTTVEAALGRRPSFDEVASALADGFAEAHGLALVPGGLSDAEARDAERLARDKYGTDAWTERSRVADGFARVP